MNAVLPIPVPQRVKLTVAQFRTLHDAGALDAHGKTELIEGTIYAMNAQQAAHAVAKSRLARRLGNALEALGSRLDAVVEATVAIPPTSAPEPDIVIAEVTAGERAYIPFDKVALAVEVSDTSRGFDLNEKAELYARHGLPEYWVLEIPTATLHQMWSPSPQGYAERRTFPLGARVESVTIAGLAVETSGLI